MDTLNPDFYGILTACLAFLIALASPGPNVIAVIGTSMKMGRGAGKSLAMGVAAGSLCWAVLTVAGLTALITAYAPALVIIKIFGGIYLLWLAGKAFRSAFFARYSEPKDIGGTNRHSSGYLLQGLVIQMTNPKAALAWIAIVSLGVREDAPAWVGISIILVTSMLSLIVHLSYAVIFSTPSMVRVYAKARRFIEVTFGVFFTVTGIGLLNSQR